MDRFYKEHISVIADQHSEQLVKSLKTLVFLCQVRFSILTSNDFNLLGRIQSCWASRGIEDSAVGYSEQFAGTANLERTD